MIWNDYLLTADKYNLKTQKIRTGRTPLKTIRT